MSLHFVIDGYNLIKQSTILNKINLKDSRAALIRFLAVYKPQGSKNNRVTVVFDGEEGSYFSREIPGIEVIFSQTQSADERIKKLVEKSSNPKNIVVVTNDRDIRITVKHFGAQVKTIEEFLSKTIPKKLGLRDEDKLLLPPIQAAKITDELKKIWLDGTKA